MPIRRSGSGKSSPSHARFVKGWRWSAVARHLKALLLLRIAAIALPASAVLRNPIIGFAMNPLSLMSVALGGRKPLHLALAHLGSDRSFAFMREPEALAP